MINDHTDAEAAHRDHAYEMGEDDSATLTWHAWIERVERMLFCVGATTEQQGLDGDQAQDGFSLDFAHSAYMRMVDPITYFEGVMKMRAEMGYGVSLDTEKYRDHLRRSRQA